MCQYHGGGLQDRQEYRERACPAHVGTCVLEIDVYLGNGLCGEQASVWLLKVSYSAVVAVDVLNEAFAKEVVGCQSQGLVQVTFFVSGSVFWFRGVSDKPTEGYSLGACVTACSGGWCVATEGRYGEA